MNKITERQFNNLKIHTQYSICKGAVKISKLKDFCKKNKISAVGISDSFNLCGALEFSENISKIGTQPLIGTQINFKFKDNIGTLGLIANTIDGYKRIVDLSSRSYLENNSSIIPYCKIEDLFYPNDGITLLSGTINGLIGNIFLKDLTDDIDYLTILQELDNNLKPLLFSK